jgi:hypothetical protein
VLLWLGSVLGSKKKLDERRDSPPFFFGFGAPHALVKSFYDIPAIKSGPTTREGLVRTCKSYSIESEVRMSVQL